VPGREGVSRRCGPRPYPLSSDSRRPTQLSDVDGLGLLDRLPACPCGTSSPTAGAGPSEVDGDPPAGPASEPAPGSAGAGGEADGDGDPGNTGIDDGGGRNGTSIAPVVPSLSSFEPAVIAASVGSDANPTSSPTSRTYLRVGPANPSAW